MAMVTHRIAIGRPGTWNPCNYPFHIFSSLFFVSDSVYFSHLLGHQFKKRQSPALRCDSHHFAPRFHNMASERPPHLNSGDLEQRWFAQLLRFGSQWRIHLWRCDHGPCPKHHTHIISHTCSHADDCRRTCFHTYIAACDNTYNTEHYWTLFSYQIAEARVSPFLSVAVACCSRVLCLQMPSGQYWWADAPKTRPGTSNSCTTCQICQGAKGNQKVNFRFPVRLCLWRLLASGFLESWLESTYLCQTQLSGISKSVAIQTWKTPSSCLCCCLVRTHGNAHA